MVLHLPIGLLSGVALLETLTVLKPRLQLRPAISVLVWVAALSGALAAVTGFVLGGEGVFKGDTIDNHRILGIVVGSLCLVLAVVHQSSGGGSKGGVVWGYRMLLLVTMGLLVPTGHLGASMSHGANFLLGPVTKKAVPPADPANDSTYAMVIQPIFAANCVSCHNADKAKGDLVLENATELLAGGKHGPVIVEGNAKQSLILTRMRLPLKDQDHMPPDESPQPSAQEIATIEAWINAGAKVTGKVDLSGAAAGVPQDAPKPQAVPTPGNAGAKVASATPAAIAALDAALVHVSPMLPGDNLLTIDFAAPASKTDDATAIGLLNAVKLQAGDLSLARTKVTDAVLDVVAQMPNLRRLDLRGTEVTDAGLAKLKGLSNLQELVLAKTKLTPAATEILAVMPGLKRVYVWASGLEIQGIEALRVQRPELAIDTGDTTADSPPELEPAFKFSSEAPPPTPPGTPVVASASLTPVNTVCPVTGSAVNPKYSVVYDGKVIGFCCPNCPKEFWAEPEKFLSKLK